MQSIAQAPRGRLTRVLPEHAHNRETPRSSIVVSDLTKVCPQCNSRAVCKCGYAFLSKRKTQSGNAMKRRRVHKASVRASETSQTLCRQEMDRVRRAGKRASETPDQ